ncbi:MAG: OmpA family protein [bacterium]
MKSLEYLTVILAALFLLHCKTCEIKDNSTTIFSYPNSTSFEMTEEIKLFVDKAAKCLEENPEMNIVITGHSDDQGTYEQNDERAKARANTIADYLVGRGIEKRRVMALSKGSIEPIASNQTEAGKRKNRRVEIKIISEKI